MNNDMIKAVYEDKEMEINGRKYRFTKTTHAVRLKVFAFLLQHKGELESGNLSFLGSAEWPKIEKILFDYITFDDAAISKSGGHFENPEHEKDYMIFVSTAMGVISYPFL